MLIGISRESSGSWEGYLYATFMFVVTLCKSFALQHLHEKTEEAGRRNWIALTAAIYKKVNIRKHT